MSSNNASIAQTSDNVSTLVFAAIFLVFLYYVFCPSNPEPLQNDGSLVKSKKSNGNSASNNGSVSSGEVGDDDTIYTVDDNEDSYIDQEVYPTMNRDDDDSVDSSIENIKERAMGRNNLFFRRKDGAQYKRNSYRDLDSGSLRDVDKQFGVQDVTKNYKDMYNPVDESKGIGAPIDIGASRQDANANKYNVNAFLPQEEEKDWFETIEQVDVKNSNLINIYRPIGVNTIGSSQKAASYDIRGYDGAICPKFVNGPWLQSSYEPDRSTKSLC